MSRGDFDKASRNMEVSENDVQGVLKTVNSTDAYTDVLSGFSISVVSIFLLLFIVGFFTDRAAGLLHGSLGYAMIVVIFIFVIQSVYRDILKSFDAVCGKDFVAEGHNKFYVIVSIAYYYTKTWIKVLLNFGFVYILVYLIYVSINANLSVPYHVTFREFPNYDILVKLGIILYIICGLYVAYQFDFKVYFAIVGRKPPMSLWGKTTIIIGLLVFFKAIFFWMELASFFWMFLMRNRPNIHLFEHDKLFMIVSQKGAVEFINMFVHGLIVCICLGFFIIPRFDPINYCKMLKLPHDEEEAENENKKLAAFKKRFIFSYFVTMTVVLALIIFDMVVMIFK